LGKAYTYLRCFDSAGERGILRLIFGAQCKIV